jgi:hypothetical protein
LISRAHALAAASGFFGESPPQAAARQASTSGSEHRNTKALQQFA